MNDLKKYIEPSAEVLMIACDIVTASPEIPSGSGGGTGKPLEPSGTATSIGGIAPDDLDMGM